MVTCNLVQPAAWTIVWQMNVIALPRANPILLRNSRLQTPTIHIILDQTHLHDYHLSECISRASHFEGGNNKTKKYFTLVPCRNNTSSCSNSELRTKLKYPLFVFFYALRSRMLFYVMLCCAICSFKICFGVLCNAMLLKVNLNCVMLGCGLPC